MILLFRRPLRPIPGCLFSLLLLSRRQLLKGPVVLQNFLLFLPRQTVESLWRRIRRRRPVGINIWLPHHVGPIWPCAGGTIRASILPFVLRSPCFLPRLPIFLPLFLSRLARRLLSWRLLPWWLALLLGRLIVLSILPPIRARAPPTPHQTPPPTPPP